MSTTGEPTTTVVELIDGLAKDKRAAGRFTRSRLDAALHFRNECGYARQIVLKSEKLQASDPDTVRECIEDVAKLGLSLSPALKHAYLVPRYVKTHKRYECTLYTSWRGLVVAGRRWGGLTDMAGAAVYSNELPGFRLVQGLHPQLEHHIIPVAAHRGPLVGAYCISYMKTGLVKIEYMDEREIAKAREYSESKRSDYSPWKIWPEEMARKTAARRASKHWQGSDEISTSLAIQHKYEGIGEPADDDDEAPPTELVDPGQITALHAKLSEADCDADKVLRRVAGVMGVNQLEELTAARLPEAEDWIGKAIKHKKEKARP